jgi:ribosomal protein S18 acetylase RimI-like enzyme
MGMLPEGYQLQSGFSRDKALLIKFLYLTYRELFPQQEDFSHLAKTVENYFSPNAETGLWWVVYGELKEKVACLWLGNAIDQVSGDRYTHIFLVYVKREHRRFGLATALLDQAQDYAQSKGDRQISLQVNPNNETAFNLYNSLGYRTRSLLMFKSLDTIQDSNNIQENGEY